MEGGFLLSPPSPVLLPDALRRSRRASERRGSPALPPSPSWWGWSFTLHHICLRRQMGARPLRVCAGARCVLSSSPLKFKRYETLGRRFLQRSVLPSSKFVFVNYSRLEMMTYTIPGGPHKQDYYNLINWFTP